MALDDLLLQRVEIPLLRLYCWKSPCVTFGYFQQWHAVSKIFPNHQLVRRSTGGGSVVHQQDLTFSLMIPCKQVSKSFSPLFFYETLHQAVAKVLKNFSLITSLTKKEQIGQHPCCFEAPALYDLLWNGVKVLGGAQRRCRGRLLYQGSLSSQLAGVIPNREKFFNDLALLLFQKVALLREKSQWIEEATVLAAKQYRLESWTKKR